MGKAKIPTVAPIISLLLSFLATSHHWLHMTILLLLGSSTNMMATMSSMLWLRRFMIVMTLLTIIFSTYRLLKHHCSNKVVIALNVTSGILSLGFIIYSLYSFGW